MPFRPVILTREEVQEEYRERLKARERDELRAWLDLLEKQAIVSLLRQDLDATNQFVEAEGEEENAGD